MNKKQKRQDSEQKKLYRKQKRQYSWQLRLYKMQKRQNNEKKAGS